MSDVRSGVLVASRIAELAGQAEHRAVGDRRVGQVGATLGDVLGHDLGVREVLEDGDDVGEPLVEREHVGVGRIRVMRAEPLEHSVCRLVGDDVVRQCGEHDLVRAGSVPGSSASAAKYPNSSANRSRRSRRSLRRTRAGRRAGAGLPSPPERASEPALERLQHAHDHRVDHLLVEPRVGLGHVDAAVEQHVGIVEVDRLVEATVHRVVVDDRDQPPGGTRVHLLVHHIGDDRATASVDHRIERQHSQRPPPSPPVSVGFGLHGARCRSRRPRSGGRGWRRRRGRRRWGRCRYVLWCAHHITDPTAAMRSRCSAVSAARTVAGGVRST